MSKHRLLGLLLVTLAPLAACEGSGQLQVRAVSVGPDGEPQGLANLPVRMLPYDRDSIFEALEARAPEAEPQIPPDLLQLRDSVSTAQSRWREAEAAWNEARSELQSLADDMQGMNRASDEYFAAFERFERLDGQEQRLSSQKDRLFEQFTALQNRYSTRVDSISAVRTAWADRAFEDYNTIVDSLLEARGQEELWDTTDGSGWASFRASAGRWWVHTRYALPYEELYWNVPVDLAGGELDTLILDTANAELRPLF
jgi:hypothetical protein